MLRMAQAVEEFRMVLQLALLQFHPLYTLAINVVIYISLANMRSKVPYMQKVLS